MSSRPLRLRKNAKYDDDDVTFFGGSRSDINRPIPTHSHVRRTPRCDFQRAYQTLLCRPKQKAVIRSGIDSREHRALCWERNTLRAPAENMVRTTQYAVLRPTVLATYLVTHWDHSKQRNAIYIAILAKGNQNSSQIQSALIANLAKIKSIRFSQILT